MGFDWQAPNSPLVLGIAAELDWLHADGTNTCLAFSGFFVSANCETRPNMTADLTARLGWAYGYAGHSLLYVKGGGALVREQLSVTTNATASFVGLAPQTTSATYNAVGWTVGAGLEHAIAPAWSVLVEYAYVGLDSKAIATPQGLVQGFPPLPLYFLTAADVTHVSSSLQEAKLGLNYKFGVDPAGQWAAPVAVFPVKAPAGIFSGWDIEAGARYFGSGAKFQKDLGDTTDPAQSSMLVSRLTYNATANSGEFFGRVEAPPATMFSATIPATGSGRLLATVSTRRMRALMAARNSPIRFPIACRQFPIQF